MIDFCALKFSTMVVFYDYMFHRQRHFFEKLVVEKFYITILYARKVILSSRAIMVKTFVLVDDCMACFLHLISYSNFKYCISIKLIQLKPVPLYFLLFLCFLKDYKRFKVSYSLKNLYISSRTLILTESIFSTHWIFET